MIRLIEQSDLPATPSSWEFEGAKHGGTNITFITINALPGMGRRLHRHPYDEVFIVQEGCATFTAEDDCFQARAGQMVIVPAGTPHKFVNSGTGLLRQVDIHLNAQFETEWLES